MERPSPVPQCMAYNRIRDVRVANRFQRCQRPAVGDLVYDKPGSKKDISWPYCQDHLKEFEPLSRDLWVDLYEEPSGLKLLVP